MQTMGRRESGSGRGHTCWLRRLPIVASLTSSFQSTYRAPVASHLLLCSPAHSPEGEAAEKRPQRRGPTVGTLGPGNDLFVTLAQASFSSRRPAATRMGAAGSAPAAGRAAGALSGFWRRICRSRGVELNKGRTFLVPPCIVLVALEVFARLEAGSRALLGACCGSRGQLAPRSSAATGGRFARGAGGESARLSQRARRSLESNLPDRRIRPQMRAA